jgi:hypothetical protein
MARRICGATPSAGVSSAGSITHPTPAPLTEKKKSYPINKERKRYPINEKHIKEETI